MTTFPSDKGQSSPTGWRRLFKLTYPRTVRKQKVLILGAGNLGAAIGHLLEDAASPYRAIGFLDDDPAKQGKVVASPGVLGTTDQLPKFAAQKGVRTAILAISGGMTSNLQEILANCAEDGVRILSGHAVYEQLAGGVPVEYVGEKWHEALPLQHPGTRPLNRVIKRASDVVLALLGMLCLAPFFPLLVLAIYLDSPGPIFYSQRRVGKGGRIFKMYKFRSMVPDAEKGEPVWAEETDPRVTRVGRILRKTHLDEFPQFLNILKGEMSAVGPRPERPEFVEELAREIPFYRMRHAVKPGMAGWGLVKQGYGASREDARIKLQYDLYYIKHQSLWLDILILFKTIIDTVTFSGR